MQPAGTGESIWTKLMRLLGIGARPQQPARQEKPAVKSPRRDSGRRDERRSGGGRDQQRRESGRGEGRQGQSGTQRERGPQKQNQPRHATPPQSRDRKNAR